MGVIFYFCQKSVTKPSQKKISKAELIGRIHYGWYGRDRRGYKKETPRKECLRISR